MKKSLSERAADLLVNKAKSGIGLTGWNLARAEWVRDYERRCLADFSNGDAMPDHRGCPNGAECDGKDIYWRPA